VVRFMPQALFVLPKVLLAVGTDFHVSTVIDKIQVKVR